MNIKPLHIPIKVIQKHLRFLQFVHVLECPFKTHIHQLYNLVEMYSNAISFFFCSETLFPVKLLYSSLQRWSSDHPKFSAFKKAQQITRAPSGKGTVPTWPEVKAIEPVGEEVITNAITTPLFTPAGVWGIPFSGSPAHSQMSSFCCHEGLGVVHHELVVPLLILRRPFADAQEDIRPHAFKRKKTEETSIGSITHGSQYYSWFSTMYTWDSHCCQFDGLWTHRRPTSGHICDHVSRLSSLRWAVPSHVLGFWTK